jgi:hypothetical protein
VHVELDEGAGQLLAFPRSRRLAGAKAHNDVLPPHRLAGVKGHRLDDSVALVEDAEHGHPLRHRRDGLSGSAGLLSLGDLRNGSILLRAAATCGERERDQQRCSKLRHAYSGIQGS